MGSSSYEIMGRRGDELHDDFIDKGRGAGAGEGLDHHGGDSRPQEYWTSSCSTLEATKPLRVKLNAREVTYGDLTTPILIPRGGRVISEGSKSWPILVDHSKENGSGFDDQDHMSPIALQGRNNDIQVPGANGMIQDRGTARGGGGDKIPKAAGDSEIEDMGAGGNTGDDDRWNPAAMGEDRGSIQQGEAGDDQVDWSIHKRQRAGRLKGPAEHWDLYTGEREPGQEDHRWEPITTAATTTVGGKNGKGSLAWPDNGGGGGGGGGGGHATYGECQKNQCADRGTTSLDGCGEFMPAGKEGKNALACAACGCHRNFHRRVMLSGEEEEEREEKREKEEGGGINYHHSSLCSIEHVAHELMTAASRAIPSLSQDFQLGHPKGHLNCVRDLSLKERKTMAKIFIENLDHIAKMMFSTAECLAMLQKPSNSRQTASSRERERENKYNNAGGASPLRTTAATSYEGPLSSDVSPVSTVEKRAVSLPPPLSLQPWDDGAAGGPKLNGGSCGTQLHNSIAISRKVAERRLGNHKSKRTRTCISMEQREKLNAFAERAGWTVVGQRKETIEAACQDIGIEPKTLKYWIHNSKQKWKRQRGDSTF